MGILTMPTSLMTCLCLVLFVSDPLVTAQRPALDKALSRAPGQNPKSASLPPQSDQSPLDPKYQLGPGDVLDIRVFNRPQLSREAVRVDSRGMIRMPLIESEIQAACHTESELAAEIATRYLKYQRNPQVDVFVKEYKSQPVAVIGAVHLPGRFQLQRPMRVLELLTFAGGPSERAGTRLQIAHSVASPLCDTLNGTVASEGTTENTLISYGLNETLSGLSQANPYVRPGDIINIPEAELAFVVGNVLRPTAIELKDTLTVSRAIAMAGGTMPDTKSAKVRIIRQLPGSTGKTEILVDLRAIEKQKAEDIALQADDIVDVPTSSGKRLLRSLVSSIFPAAGQLPVQMIGGQIPTAGSRRPR